MRRVLVAVALALALAWSQAPMAGDAGEADKDPLLTQVGDALQFGIPLAALGMTFFLDDDCASGDDCASPGLFADSVGMAVDWGHLNGAPRHDLAVALVRTEFVTYGLKYGVQEQRPNGAGESFPSGHTSISFAGAEFIRKQYGWGWGVPAYLAASYVGWSRVESGNHWTHDVLAGAAIGILSNHDLERIELPFGTLSLAGGRVAGFAHAALTNLDGANDALAADAPAPAAGLRIELRF